MQKVILITKDSVRLWHCIDFFLQELSSWWSKQLCYLLATGYFLKIYSLKNSM